MGPDAPEAGFHIKEATEDDWPWMMNGHVESAWQSMTAERQKRVTRGTVRERLSQHAARTRGPNGSPNQAFIARDQDGREGGFVWVAEFPRGFTGEREAFILDVYVSEHHRGKGLGRDLMEAAEDWARKRGLRGIALNVAVHNGPARMLYKTLCFQVESLQMSKRLDE